MVEAEDVTFRYRTGLLGRRLMALDGLSLQVREGDFFALLGQNGAGKSTAMGCFLGLLRPTGGRVRILGEPLKLGSALYQKIGYLPEESHYHGYLTVEEAVSYYAALYRRRVTRAEIGSLLERVGLEGARKLRIDRCSKGMKQKVGIVQCLLNEPTLLFLDEPMRGLDPLGVKDFRDALLDLHKRGTTIVMNSHILSEVEMVANRVAILHKGRLVALDTTAALLRRETDVYRVSFETGRDVPDCVAVDTRHDGRIVGTVGSNQLREFLAYAQSPDVRLLNCELRTRSLEETFTSIISASRDA
jgi:ABC-2 type transport system ATP-binding protein